MGRSVGQNSSVTIQLPGGTPGIRGTQEMPISGKFGEGKIMMVPKTQVITIPAASIRVRLWGAGGGDGGCGGGFAMKVITGLTPGSTVNATIGLGGTMAAPQGGTTSFGAYCSASGGSGKVITTPAVLAQVPGRGVGGDINSSGGRVVYGANYTGGAGVGNLLGDGGNSGCPGASGGGGDSLNGFGAPNGGPGTPGGRGLAPLGVWSLDFFGCGSGSSGQSIILAGNQLNHPDFTDAGNGGGGGYRRNGSVPGGGSGAGFGLQPVGGDGYLIMEW